MSSDLENRIAAQLRIIGAAKLQQLAEDMAAACYPERFSEIQVRGRNAEGQTVKGWPDAFAISSDGKIDAIEATREKQSWTAHLEADLNSATKPGAPKLSGYFFVGGYPDHRPSEDDLSAWKERFCRLGVDQDRVTILLGMGLVRELAKPRYARVRLAHLGLAPVPELFRLVRSSQSPGGAGPFAPEPDEYVEGKVHRSRWANEIESRLVTDGCVAVRGRGAAGKTVLAHLIAIGARYRGLPVYWADLAQLGSSAGDLRGRLEKQIVEFGGNEILFVLDNIHLAEELAEDVYNFWEEVARHTGTRLLLVGRETHRSDEDKLQLETNPWTILLRAQREEMIGAYRRIMGRRKESAAIPEPPHHILREWARIFGGDPDDAEHSVDLMAFSAAVQRKAKRIIETQDLTLDVSDARIEVRDRYLLKLSAGEMSNLFRLAALPEDVSLPDGSLADPYAPFERSLRNGLVYRRRHGVEAVDSYSLAHAALGRLILAAASPPVDRAKECVAVAKGEPQVAFYLASAAATDGDENLAREILTVLSQNVDWLDAINVNTDLAHYLEMSQRLGINILSGLEGFGVAHLPALGAYARRTSLQRFTNLMEFCRRPSNGINLTYDYLRQIILDDTAACAQRCLDDPSLNFVLYFLNHLRNADQDLQDVYGELVRVLTENISDVLEKIRLSNLPDIVRFIVYTKSDESFLKIYNAAVTYIASPDANVAEKIVEGGLQLITNFFQFARSDSRLSRLTSDVMRIALEDRIRVTNLVTTSGLSQIASFGGYLLANRSLRTAYNIFSSEIIRQRRELADRLRAASLDNVCVFLRFVRSAPLGVVAVYRECLSCILRYSGEFAKRAERTPIQQVVQLLRDLQEADNFNGEAIATTICQQINLQEWNAFRSKERPRQPTFFVILSHVFGRLERPELSQEPAKRLICTPDWRIWQQDVVGLHHLAQVVSCAAPGLEDSQLTAFVTRVLTNEWLERNFRDAGLGGIAGGLFRMMLNLPAKAHSLLVLPGLKVRVTEGLVVKPAFPDERLAVALSLWGVAALLGEEVEPTRYDDLVACLTPARTSSIIRSRVPDSDTLGFLQAQLWLGLRQAASADRGVIEVEAALGEDTLAKWLLTTPRTDFAAALNSSMIDWLDRCRANEWVLATSDRPLRTSVLSL